jgi:hypothetical protein
VYRTDNGTLYLLEGPPEAAYAKWCAENGLNFPLSDPVRFPEATPDDEQRDDPDRDVAPRRPEVSR